MKEIEIKMQAPFAFCEECNLKQLISEARYAGGNIIKALRECEYCNVCSIAVDGDCPFGGRNTLEVTAADALEAAERRIAELEAQLPKRGEWIGIEYDGYADGYPVYDVWECSKCGEEHNGEEDTLPNYCPNCGARMEKGEHE